MENGVDEEDRGIDGRQFVDGAGDGVEGQQAGFAVGYAPRVVGFFVDVVGSIIVEIVVGKDIEEALEGVVRIEDDEGFFEEIEEAIPVSIDKDARLWTHPYLHELISVEVIHEIALMTDEDGVFDPVDEIIGDEDDMLDICAVEGGWKADCYFARDLFGREGFRGGRVAVLGECVAEVFNDVRAKIVVVVAERRSDSSRDFRDGEVGVGPVVIGLG